MGAALTAPGGGLASNVGHIMIYLVLQQWHARKSKNKVYARIYDDNILVLLPARSPLSEDCLKCRQRGKRVLRGGSSTSAIAAGGNVVIL